MRIGVVGEYQVNEAQAEVVRRIYALHADGNGCRRIVNILRAEGAPAPGALGWSNRLAAAARRAAGLAQGRSQRVQQGASF